MDQMPIWRPRGGGGTFDNGLYGQASSERATFFKLPIYKRVGKFNYNILNRYTLWLYQSIIRHYMKMMRLPEIHM